MERLEELLARHTADGKPLSTTVLAELDRREEFPVDACSVLDDFGLRNFYVPVRHGGELVDCLELMELTRTVAWHDLTVAVAYGKTFLGGVSIWVGGRADQAAELAARIKGGALVSWGLSEREHGSDLLAGEMSATRVNEQWTLDGEKWLINNATRGELMCVLARTSPSGGARGFSLFLVDKHRLAPGRYECLPKVLTHGIRGADISGIRLHDAEVPGTALVGEVGQGLEIVLKALQLTRTVCTGLSLGAGHRALRLATDFVVGRHLYGRRLIELPQVRRILGRACASLLLAEATSIVACRSVHALPAEMSVISAIAKAFVPTVVQGTLDELAELMGARGFLTAVHADGIFAKLERDHRIVGIFDGSTAVNRNVLINHFPSLARGFRGARWDAAAVREATSLKTPARELDFGALGLLSAGGCSVVQGLEEFVGLMPGSGTDGRPPDGLRRLADDFREANAALHLELLGHRLSAGAVPSAAFGMAQRYELCFAGASALGLWLHNAEGHKDAAPLWRDGLWLRACLTRILDGLDVRTGSADERAYDELAELLADGCDLRLLGSGVNYSGVNTETAETR